ncbi:MAG: class I SAM-dependent methyltransferase [Chloroflexi bacterium]|nr:MAG: class I SAM-dependent methyltransferase [Chloroflexota bacterium]
MERRSSKPTHNPLSSVEPWNIVADGYTAELMAWAEFYASKALELASLPSSPHIVDIAAGPGSLALLAARGGATVSAIDFSVAMIANLWQRMAKTRPGLVDVHVADGQALPFQDSVFDGAFSMAGLIFFPNRATGFQEMLRVLRSGRRAVVSSIASIKGSFAQVLEAMSIMVPGMPNASNNKPPLSDSQSFFDEMTVAGFREVTIHTIKHIETTPTLDEFWRATERSAAPVAFLRRKLGEERWEDVANGVKKHLRETVGAGPYEEVFTMHLGVGVK